MIRRNLVVLTGRATKKPELKQVSGNSQVCTIRMVSNKRVKRKNGEYEEKPMFIDAECWGQRAAYAAEHIDKGTVISVVGELEQDEWGEGDNRRQKHKIYVSFDLQIDKQGAPSSPSDEEDEDTSASASSRQQKRATAKQTSGGSTELPF